MTAYDLTLQALDLFSRMDRGSIAQARELLEREVRAKDGVVFSG